MNEDDEGVYGNVNMGIPLKPLKKLIPGLGRSGDAADGGSRQAGRGWKELFDRD